MRRGPLRRSAALAPLAALALLPALAAAQPPAWQVADGHAERGPALMARFGCPGCHAIPGIADAHGNVGPPLAHVGSRSVIAGLLPNTPENLVHWIRQPQAVVPGNAMPDMGIGERDARDIAAYLYTLR